MDSIIRQVIRDAGFNIIHTKSQPARPAQYASYDNLNISDRARRFIKGFGISYLWKHQSKAIQTALSGKNVCVSTSTSSGKTEIFQIIAIDILERNEHAKVLAVYSAKALNSQQRDRWNKTGFTIGQIDGSNTDMATRLQTLKESRVVVMTPDVMHAFLLGKLADKNCNQVIKDFIRQVEYVIIDEIHLYRGVFGTNAAYLFRRFNNLRHILRKDSSFPLYVTASATLPNPAEHSQIITGAPSFVNIGRDDDGSPMSTTHFFYIKPDKELMANSQHSGVSGLALNLSEYPQFKSITFVESRQRTGELILEQEKTQIASLSEHKIYPYRAGIEEDTRDAIMKCMKSGDFRGIISTSALEIGIDIDGLNVAVIANTPYDRNSYYQRIGRVGRGSCKESFVIILYDGSFKSELLFNEYDFDIDRLLPDLEPSLYLESKDVQYVHACCHSDFDKECCELRACGCTQFDTRSKPYFPPTFCQICEQIATHQTTRDYDNYADVEQPHRQYSLRNNSTSYQFVQEDNTEIYGEQVNREQLLHEAYKGAIRNITRKSKNEVRLFNQEIIRIDKAAKTIEVRNFYNTNVKSQPESRTYIYPNFSRDRRFNTASCGEAFFYNLELYERVSIYGYHRILFKSNDYFPYDRPFIDTLRTTGVIMFHPALQQEGVNRSQIAELIFEEFLMRRAFDRNDIKHRSGKLYTPHRAENLDVDDRFVAFYDINQLNITSNLIKEETLHDLFLNLRDHLDAFAMSLFKNGINEQTRQAVWIICQDILNHPLISETAASVTGYMDIYAMNSEALYCPDYQNLDTSTSDDEDSETDWILCRVLSPLKADIPNQVTYTILDANNQLSFMIPQEALKPTDSSLFCHYDWPHGVIVNE